MKNKYLTRKKVDNIINITIDNMLKDNDCLDPKDLEIIDRKCDNKHSIELWCDWPYGWEQRELLFVELFNDKWVELDI